MLKILFMGSGELACPALKMLLDRADLEVVGVVTQPDRPAGRRRKLAACPAKILAEEQGVAVFCPEKIGAPESFETLQGLQPDLSVVAAYGQYIPGKILSLPPMESINIHPSMLPKYRGASPVQWALADGLTETGVTILYVSKEMDAGDIILQEVAPIEPEDTAATLLPRLAEQGGQLLSKVIDQLLAGTAQRTPQDESEAHVVTKLAKEDGRVDWSMSAEQIKNRVRGFYPWPCCFCEIPEGVEGFVRLIRVRVEEAPGEAGVVLEVSKEGPLVGAGEQSLRLLEVQPPGKKPMNGQAFLNGHPLKVGDRLG